MDDGGRSAHWDLQSSRNVFGQFCLRGTNISLDFMLGLCSDMHCQGGTLCRKLCSSPNHVQSTEFTSSGLQVNCRKVSRMKSGDRKHLSSVLSSLAKAVNMYVRVISVFLLFKSLSLCEKNVEEIK